MIYCYLNWLYKSLWMFNKLCGDNSTKLISSNHDFVELLLFSFYLHLDFCSYKYIERKKTPEEKSGVFCFKTYHQNKRIIVAIPYYFSLLDKKDKIMLKIA